MALTLEFIDHKVHPINAVRPEWRVENTYGNYELDLKMCQLKSLTYDFKWVDERGLNVRLGGVTDAAAKILKLDLSLNELTALEHEELAPFINVRELNASLNKIQKLIGIEVCRNLYTLNLSHNSIKRIDSLVAISSLVELNISMNNLKDISLMPSLVNLQILNVNNNELTSLDGVQALPRLSQLFAQRNEIKHILPLTGCFHLQILNVSSNAIKVLHTVLGVLSQLTKLQVLNMHGNQVERDPQYQTEILKQTNVMTLDNVAVNPLPKQPIPSYDSGNAKHARNIESLKDAAKQAFEERMRESKQKMQESVNFLQKRILDLQHEYADYEGKLNNDLDACLRYLDSLTLPEIGNFDRSKIRESMGTPGDKPWHDGRKTRTRRDKPDYSHIKETDELLRYAQKELGQGNE